MSIDLSIQNFSQLFWTIIVALNLYVVLLLYRVSKLYRVERLNKLHATADLKENIDLMRIEYANSITSASVSTPSSCRSRFSKLRKSTTSDRVHPKSSKLPQQSAMIGVSAHNVAHLDRGRSRSCVVDQKFHRDHNAQHLKQVRHMPDVSTSSSVVTNRSEGSCNHLPKEDELHTLYISDSFGRVVHEIPFREHDYVEALRSVLSNQ